MTALFCPDASSRLWWIGSFREADGDAKSFQFVVVMDGIIAVCSVMATTNTRAWHRRRSGWKPTVPRRLFYDLGKRTIIGKHGNGRNHWDFDGKSMMRAFYTRALESRRIASIGSQDQNQCDRYVLITADTLNDIPIEPPARSKSDSSGRFRAYLSLIRHDCLRSGRRCRREQPDPHLFGHAPPIQHRRRGACRWYDQR